jgi:hypothetical protein
MAKKKGCLPMIMMMMIVALPVKHKLEKSVLVTSAKCPLRVQVYRAQSTIIVLLWNQR